MDISRRQLAGVILAGTAAAQTPAAPKPQPEGDLEAARSQLRAASQAIARVALPITVEPAFQFKA